MADAPPADRNHPQHDRGLEILHKADAVIRAFSRRPSLSIAELAAEVDEPVSTLYRLVASLTALGLVDQTLTRGRYRLGLASMSTGEALDHRLDLRPIARPELERLRDETDLTAFLCVRRGSRAACIERVAGTGVQSLVMLLGASLPLYAGGAPKAILAFLPQSERTALACSVIGYEPDDPAKPPIETILRDAEDARTRGYAVSDGDVTNGVAAVGAPVFNHRDEVVAAISFSGLRPAVLGEQFDARLSLLLRCADTITRKLSAQE